VAAQVAAMSARNLELLTAPDAGRKPPEGWAQAPFDDALRALKRLDGVMKWRRVRLLVEQPAAVPNPLKTYLALLLLAPAKAEICSMDGATTMPVGLGALIRAGLRKRRAPLAAAAEVLSLLRSTPLRQENYAEASAPPFYWRPNLWFGARVGGAYSHAAGVANAVAKTFGAVDMATTDDIPLLSGDIALKRIDLGRVDGWHAGAGVHFIANDGLFSEALRLCASAPRFIYQRSSLGDISGLRLARRRRRPLVLEYNGPEVWVAKNWGEGIPFAEEFAETEMLLLQRADLVLVVSKPLLDEVIARGVDPGRVLLSPNAVDPDRFHPGCDGSAARARLGLGDRRAALLLSSFGPWHGAEIAVEAYADLLETSPQLSLRTALVLAGDGQRRKDCMAIAARRGLVEGETIHFPGMIPAADAPSMLAAGDVLLSPTLENPDGSAFFGSPTKIFEYMAMGKLIIASDIAQIGEMLKDRETALLVRPGDREGLRRALQEALEGRAPAGLGDRARADAVRFHSWQARMAAMAARLDSLASPR